MSSSSYDLTDGNIVNKLLLVAVPVMGTMFIQMTYNLTDMFWLGRISNEAVASSGTAGMYMWLSMAFVLVGRLGAEIGVSQNLGRGDKETAKAFSRNALFFAAVMGTLCGLTAMFFSGPLISVFNIRERSVAENAARYLSIVGTAFPAVFISASVSGTFSGSGNSRIAFVSNASGLAVNMALDPLLIFYFRMGVTGAAVATVIAQLSVAAIFLTAIKKSPGRPFSQYSFRVKAEWQKIKLILRWCLPVSLESLLFTALSMTMTRLVTAFGAEALAAQRVGTQIESLSWLIGGGFGTALTAFTGQNYGAGNWARIRRGFRISLWMMTSWGVIVTILLFFGGRQLFAIFLSGGEILDIGEQFMKILAFCQIFACFEAVAAGVFRGIGKTVPPSLSSIICNALRVPLAYFLSLTQLGLNGIWLAMSLGAAGRGAMVLAWYLIKERSLHKTRVDLEAA